MPKFIDTMSDVAFATKHGISEFQLVQNPNTGKLFVVTDTGLRLAPSQKIKTADDLNQALSVSTFDPEDGITEPFLMVHPTGTSDANVVAKKSFAKVATPVANIEAQV